jgi:G3E family GTPase
MGVPFSVIGGFLGAGKTTWINQLLADPQGVRYGVLVNDFGDLAIDASLLQGDKREVVSLDNGCACCSAGGDLAVGIGRLLDLCMEHILLECSGVAIPGRMVKLASLAKGLTPHATITLINAHTLDDLLSDQWMADTYVKQLQSGGQLLLNRLHDGVQVSDVEQRLSNANIPQPIAKQASLSPAEWLSIPVGTSQFIPVHESQVFNTANLMPTSLGQAQTWAQQAAANHHIYRMKGFVKDAQKTWLIQVVGDQIDIQQVSAGDNGLVVIGTDVKAVVWA